MDDSVPSNMTRRVAWGLMCTHVILMFGLIFYMFWEEPREWHRSFFVSDVDPKDAGSVAAGFYEVAITKDGEVDPTGDWLADNCGGYEAITGSDIWDLGDNKHTHHIIANHSRDICRFQRVGRSWAHGGDPLGFHILSSGTPVFLFVSIQVIVACSLLATSSALKTFFSTPLIGMGRARVWNPVDQTIAMIILFGWIGLTFMNKNHFVIVNNNMLLVFLTSIFTSVGFVVWSWRKAAPSGYASVNTVEPVFSTPPSVGMDVGFSQGSRKAVLKMPAFTNVPMVPYDRQGNNEEAENNPTMHLVDQTFDVLWRNHVLVFPRFILAASVLPVLVGAAMYKSGSVWLYTDVFYLTLAVFLTTAVCVPLYSMTRISVMVAQDTSGAWTTGRSSLSWFIIVVHLLFTHFVFLAAFVYQSYSLFWASGMDETQPDNSMMPPLIASGCVVLYNLTVWVWCLILVMSPRSGNGGMSVFNAFAWFVEGAITLFITAPVVYFVVW